MQPLEVVGGPLGVGCGMENGPLVGFEDRQPVPEIGGVVVSDLGGEPEVGAEESGPEFGDKFLPGVALIAEPLTPEVPVQPGGVAGPVGLMPISA